METIAPIAKFINNEVKETGAYSVNWKFSNIYFYTLLNKNDLYFIFGT